MDIKLMATTEETKRRLRQSLNMFTRRLNEGDPDLEDLGMRPTDAIERAAFEEFMVKELRLHRSELSFADHRNQYDNHFINLAWKAWQGRAALPQHQNQASINL
jgi:hypothetical protein